MRVLTSTDGAYDSSLEVIAACVVMIFFTFGIFLVWRVDFFFFCQIFSEKFRIISDVGIPGFFSAWGSLMKLSSLAMRIWVGCLPRLVTCTWAGFYPRRRRRVVKVGWCMMIADLQQPLLLVHLLTATY